MNDSSDPHIIERAVAGSYGLRPSAGRLPAETRIRQATLQVSSLPRSREFYEHTLGFCVLSATGDTVSLGVEGGDAPLIDLVETPGTGRRSPGRRHGLYHVAMLLPTREVLGRFLRHLDASGVRVAAGDHLVSEALYLQDPDNLGIEVYADRPRSDWRRRGEELVMGTDPVDLTSLRACAGHTLWNGLPIGTTIGHVHLHVGDIDVASKFYSEALGLDRTVWSYPGALFLSAGGYHHHLGLNTWAGRDAVPPLPEEAQLVEWTMQLPLRSDVNDVSQRLRAAGAEVVDANGVVRTRDPWGTHLRIVAAAQ